MSTTTTQSSMIPLQLCKLTHIDRVGEREGEEGKESI